MVIEDPAREQSYLQYSTDKEAFLEQMKQISLSVYASQGKELYISMENFLKECRTDTEFDSKQYGPYTTKRGSFTQLRQKGFRKLY